jgi:hypothetical protein
MPGEKMENPATWGEAEKIVNRALDEFYENIHKPVDERVIGLSLARSITDALREAGLLTQ